MRSSFYDTPIKQFKWNWGAFMYNWIFGYANRAWLTFLCFVPILNIVWLFVCGAKGEKWVWNTGHFEDGASFRAVMDSWNRAGKLAFIITVVFVVIAVVGCVIACFFFWPIIQEYVYTVAT